MKARRVAAPMLCECRGFLRAARAARELRPELPRWAIVAAARERSPLAALAFARGITLREAHIIEGAARALLAASPEPHRRKTKC